MVMTVLATSTVFVKGTEEGSGESIMTMVVRDEGELKY